MSKQDGYASRTAADLERKYNFGKTFAEVYGLAEDAQKAASEAKEYIDNLDQEAIFNLLTNFGQAQGVYRGGDGNVYINASYIKSGKLAADYIDATNLKVAAANITGELVATQINTKELKVLAANITGTLTAGQIDTTNLKVSAANVTGKLTASQIDATNLSVNAANITGTLTADQIDATNLSVDAANITGSLSASRISGGTLEGVTLVSEGYGDGVFTDPLGIYSVTIDSGSIVFNAGVSMSAMFGTMFIKSNGSNGCLSIDVGGTVWEFFSDGLYKDGTRVVY